MDDAKNQKEANSRREWLRRVAVGAAGLSAGITGGCSSGKQTGGEKADFAAPLAAKNTVAGNMVQVICHGMMAFKLPKPGSGYNWIEIHVPLVTATAGMKDQHVYKAGTLPTSANYMNSDLASGAAYTLNITYDPGQSAPTSLPASLSTSSLVFLYSASDTACKSTIPAPGQTPYCVIRIPLPDDYKGYVNGQNTNPATPIFMGSDADHCSVNTSTGAQVLNRLTSTPLVHVFRYTNVARATLDETSPSPANHWTASGADKLQIYAEPAIKMPISNAHLVQLEKYVGIDTSYLDFSNTNLTVANDPGDLYVSPTDLQALFAFSTSPGLTGSLADCISIYGS